MGDGRQRPRRAAGDPLIFSLHVAFDHRIMDGVLAAQLTLRIKDLLENPDQLDALDVAQALPEG